MQPSFLSLVVPLKFHGISVCHNFHYNCQILLKGGRDRTTMKMPPQKPVGNGYYGYEDVSHFPSNTLDNEAAATGAGTPDDPNSTNADNDFAEYLWMENEEEFDKQVMQQLEEEELMEQCLEAMLEEEQNNVEDRTNRTNSQCSQISEGSEILNLVNNFKLDLVDVTKSTLNPLAAEFVPDIRNAQSVTNSE